MTKPYKCRVEYLESSGTQYIDTGIKGKNNIDFDYKVNFANVTTSSGYGIGGEWENGKSLYLGLIRSNGNFAYHYANTNAPAVVLNSVSANTDYSIQGHMWSGEQYMVINGTKSAVGTITGTFEATQNITLFRVTSSSPIYCYAKIYYCKIWDNDTLVRDLIPVLDNNGRPAMYDNVSGQLFYNQGTGEFTYGRKIIPVEYLESTGTQYIDTGIYPTQLTEAEYRCAVTGSVSNADSHLFGSRLSASSEAFDLAYMNTSPNGIEKFRFIHGTTTTQETTTSVTASQLANPHTYYMSGTSFKVDGSEKMSFATASFIGSYSLWLFGVNSADSLHNQVRAQRVYKCKIWDNNTLVRDYIPCVDENNVPFMFDLVNCKIYENAGTGQFKVGANVEKSGNKNFLRKKLDMFLATLRKKRPYYCEVEYLESTGTQYIDTEYKLSTGTTHSFNGNIEWRQSLGNANFFYGYRSVDSAEYRGDMRAFFVYGASPMGRLAIRYGVNADNSTSYISQNRKYNISFDGTNLKVDGTTFVSLSSSYTPADYKNMYLFYCNCTGYYSADVAHFAGRIYNWQIFEDGVAVRDFIPVLDWTYTPCMYDKVSGKLFYNQGTGTFSYGREIHYVDWLEAPVVQSGSPNNPWINTGLKYFPDFEIGVQLRESVTNTCLGTGSANRLERNNANNPYWKFTSTQTYVSTIPITEYHVLKWKNDKIYSDDIYLADATKNSSTQSNCMALFGMGTTATSANGFHNVISFCKLWNPTDGSLVRDFKPMVDNNGVGAMFDAVTHTIFDNAGTGVFKYPAREVEYLQSSGTQYIDTGIKIDDTCGYDISWMALNSDDRIIFGTKGSGDSRWVLSGSNNPYVNLSWNTSYGSSGLGLNKIQTARMNYLNDRKRILNNIQVTNISETLSPNASTYNVGIFGGYWGSSTISLYSTCRIYYAKITKGTEFIRDFIPVLQDGQAGMLDKANNVFYSNVGTGSFEVGKIVESKWE